MKLQTILRRLQGPIVRAPLPGFDAVYYQYWYRDVLKFGGSPLGHYLHFGWKEGRDPSAGFSTSGYLDTNPDVGALGICPLLHFLETGFAEGRTGWKKDPKAAPLIPKAVNEPMKLLAAPRA